MIDRERWLQKRIDEVEDNNIELRMLLWELHYKGAGTSNHGPNCHVPVGNVDGHTPYGDDGEMQCCGVDFRRDDIMVIREKGFGEKRIVHKGEK